DERALIPRPETELLVEIGTTLPAGSSVLDVGTGSGAVALALKDERPDLDVSASDLDARALALARENARMLGAGARFILGRMLAGAGSWRVRCERDIAGIERVVVGELAAK